MGYENDIKFEDTIIKLFEKASDDGMVSDEEGELIMGIKCDLKTYINAVKKAEEDGIITIEEALILDELKNKIIANAGAIAAKDFNMNRDELNLIRKLFEILQDEY
ncbi:MAG: hypothetical protein ACC656_06255 [Candidatus Heimdallarchaeota archaeon]